MEHYVIAYGDFLTLASEWRSVLRKYRYHCAIVQNFDAMYFADALEKTEASDTDDVIIVIKQHGFVVTSVSALMQCWEMCGDVVHAVQLWHERFGSQVFRFPVE